MLGVLGAQLASSPSRWSTPSRKIANTPVAVGSIEPLMAGEGSCEPDTTRVTNSRKEFNLPSCAEVWYFLLREVTDLDRGGPW